jgi:acetyltransferase-like isoleucine patch superfamily enzyme
MLDGVHRARRKRARMEIGDNCCVSNFCCANGNFIGSYLLIGWLTTIADTDFYPSRQRGACSPFGKGRARPPIAAKSVVIEGDVWTWGPSVMILEGVRIGADALHLRKLSAITR